jgi:transposase
MPDAIDSVQEITELRALLAAREAELAMARAELTAAALRIEQYKAQLAKLRRMQFGRSSEKLDAQIEQLELLLEDLEESEAAWTAPAGKRALDQPGRERRQPVRRPLPDHLPREEIVHYAGSVCPGCGGTHFGKYLDGLPLYRQSAILAREGVEIERTTLADWVGHVAWWVAPLAELIGAQVMAAPVIHTDDTPIAVLAPGNGKTRTGRLWAYVLDERPWQGGRTPAAYYRFSPDRKGERPRDHLAGFRGVIQADAFAGYEALARSAASGRGPPRLIHAACWAHARRKFYDVFESTKSPIAEEALKRISELYAIETEIAGHRADTRLAARQDRAMPILDALHNWLVGQRRRLSSKNALARAIQYALSRWEALIRYTGDGRLAIDNNVAERALRGIAITRKNFLFLGSEAGGERAAILYTVLESAKLNGLDPEAYLADVIDRMARGHPIKRLAELLPWNWQRQPARMAA